MARNQTCHGKVVLSCKSNFAKIILTDEKNIVMAVVGHGREGTRSQLQFARMVQKTAR